MGAIHRLSALAIKAARKPGGSPDGGGLYLNVARGGSKAWVYRYTLRKRVRYMGLGPMPLVGLAEVREIVARWRRVRWEGRDPLEVRQAEDSTIGAAGYHFCRGVRCFHCCA